MYELSAFPTAAFSRAKNKSIVYKKQARLKTFIILLIITLVTQFNKKKKFLSRI